MIPQIIDKSQIPHKPGIYMFKDDKAQVIYVGKAVDLYNRVSSYFKGYQKDVKTRHLVSNIKKVDTIIVESELEALILEANLIKKYLPLYNINLKDDRDYLYIAVTKEEYPKVITARRKDLKPIKAWFGPFPSSTTVKKTLKKLRRVFPWCSNPPGSRNKNLKPCFYYHLNLCPGACIGAISKADYQKIINQFCRFLNGQKQELVAELAGKMTQLSDNLHFEDAQKIKRTLEGIEYITQPTKITGYLENPNFLQDQNKLGLSELQKYLNLGQFPERIEAYDISNISGEYATGSMVVLTQGEIDKSQYRRFKIKISGKPNDYAMHEELMRRRLHHKEWSFPQLFLIDGGRGQVRAAKKELDKKNILIPVLGLAKRMEWLYPPQGEVIKLSKSTLALRLLQKIRDESHRFAITYHRKLRQRGFLI